MAKANIGQYNGSPALMVDGKPCPPMAMTTRLDKPDYLKALGEAGLRVFFLMANTSWLRPGGAGTDDEGNPLAELSGFGQFAENAQKLLRAVPDAYIIVRVGLHPPVNWVESHPDDVMRYHDGSTKPAILASEVHEDKLPGMYSLCSEAWREDGAAALREFCDEVEKQPFADRVIGYFLAAGGTSEWYPINPITDREKGLCADYSPAFRAEYSRVLREKYGNVERLRAAWQEESADFENPPIPSFNERRYAYIDEIILDAFLHYEDAHRMIGKQLELNPSSPYNLGVFLNANAYSRVADFFYAWHRGTANTIIHFAQVIKAHYPGKVVGAFYGSYGCTDFFSFSTAGATLPIMDSGVIDFLAAPGVYNNREPGGYVAQREMQDSFRLRNQMFVVEEDSRTHLENDFYRDSMGLYTEADTLKTLKRDFARNLCEDIYAWWFDQHPGGGRYRHEAIYELFARQQEVARIAYTLPRKKHNEIALIYDQESLFYVSQATNELMLDFYRSSDLGRIGAPVDYYFHDDMARSDMPDYKMYLMLNLFCLTDAERETLHRKAARNGATVVWLYAPGFINPDAALKMDNGHIRQLTGFSVERTDETCSPRFRLCGRHPATRFGKPWRRYGTIDRDLHSNVWLGSVINPPFVNPRFHLLEQDGDEILGRYLIDGKAAYALKKYKGFTSVYCAAQILRSELLASLAAYSGCHLYLADGQDDLIYANQSFVTIHAHTEGRKVLHFREPVSPYEVYERRYYGSEVSSITLDLLPGDTLTFCTCWPDEA